MAERVLTQRELNRAVLARQLLLERARLPIPRALERVAGLQTQYAPSGYVGLWTRLESFARDDLTKALDRRSVVQATLMRTTIHLVSARDYPLFRVATRDARREHWLNARKGKVDARRLASSARRVEKLLADGPRHRDELFELVGSDSMVRNVGAPASRHLRARRRVARAVRGHAGGGRRAPRPSLPGRVRARAAARHRGLGRHTSPSRNGDARAAPPAPFPR